MAFDDEIEAFRRYMGLFGERSTLLIDTYDTVKAAEDRGGGPAPLGRSPRQRRPEASHEQSARSSTPVDSPDAHPLSGDLDEHRVAALVADRAPIDAFGVARRSRRQRRAGTRRVKLVETVRDGRPCRR